VSQIASKSQLRMSYLRFALFTVRCICCSAPFPAGFQRQDNAGMPRSRKPAIMPPGWAFPVAWTILYIFLGLAIAIILYARGARGRGLAVTLFVAQLLLNYAWSPVFLRAAQDRDCADHHSC
jgi:tryptophan-rich sensory protein